jgi:pimeloyl-ACP methyl ester carboxylesterase
VTSTAWTLEKHGAGRLFDVNGISFYVETHGTGSPMVLLHGGLGSGEMFGAVLPALADHHEVFLVDLQGHGRTADVDRAFDIALMADDMAALIDQLGLDRPDVVGFSLGGGVAVQTAIRHPDAVGRLVAASAHVSSDAIYAEMRAQQGMVNASAAEFMKETPMYELYQRVAPHPENFPQLLDKIGALMAVPFDFTEEVRGLRVPTLVIAADADMAPPRHYVDVFELLGGGQRDGGWGGEGRPAGGHALAILPGLTHYDLVDSQLFAAVTLAFLDQAPAERLADS